MSQRHHIRKQSFELRVSSDTDVFGIQQSLSRHFWDAVAPRMEALFNQLVSSDQVIVIDRLEIDLGFIPLQELTSEEGLLKLIKQLDLTLSGKIEAARNKVERRPVTYNTWEQWYYFLKNGSLPWSCDAPDEDWWRAVLEGFVTEASLIEKLKELLQKYPTTLSRLVWQHSDKFLTSLVEIYTGNSQKALTSIRDELIAWYLDPYDDIPVPEIRTDRSNIVTDNRNNSLLFKERFWRFILDQAILKSRLLSTEQLMMQYIKHLLTPSELASWTKYTTKKRSQLLRYPAVADLLLKIGQSSSSKTKPETSQSERPDIRNDDHKRKTIPSQKKEEELDLLNLTTSIKDDRLILSDLVSQSVTDGEVDKQPELSDQEWYLDQAGMVLLHPFLARFFEKLELVRDGVFIDDANRHKAIHLLHYLATGATQPHEYELALAKLLCDWPQTAPLRKEIVLTEAEMEESENLLKAAIENWSVLGNTSIEGLREGFFYRDGKLIHGSGGWQLLVEQKSIDVLLDQIPWNLSMIKLPWMKELLRVEWR